ncbi:Protein of unknown function DUF1045 [Rhodopseudomonas palustris HaA2]|uniref:Phosphonate metabolism protein n=1 Tax=Rhodopseudomonas palustris (strain HaA2) TaxID=316058 RepID=Q2ISN6_RHOP2|nr:DUF1045 domain-containing protein [Rhodopseudomonas palustris]ABD08774.1 Protein of unknown function DUF1045 [Rhodopseudomonas palustris HaA2]
MTQIPRYAIYYLPPPGSVLDRFGSALLGYDVVTGAEPPFPEAMTRAVPDWAAITREPRKYGFHATLKAPIALAAGQSEAELLWACATFAETPRAIPVIAPVVQSIGSFIAVVPSAPSDELVQLATDCVRSFDTFRAPLTAADRARRKPAQLTPRQIQYLDHWGYPYVIEEFRFHMTLTGSLDRVRHVELLGLLRQQFDVLDLGTLAIDRIAVCRQDSAGERFRSIGQFQLRPMP